MPKFGAYMRGEGTKGEQGDAAGFNNISATAYTVEGETPIVSVSTSGSNTALDVAFNFGLVRGEAAGFSTEQNATIEVISVTSSPIISVTTDDSSPNNSKVFDFYFGIPHPNDIVNIVQTSTAVEDEGNNEITVYYRNNETATFYVKNGSKGTPAIIEGSVSSTSQLPTTNLHNGMSYIVGTNTKRLYVYLNGNWTDQGSITAAGFGVPEGTLEILPYEDEFTVNGKIANFESDREALVNNLTVGIDPVQDLHGYDNPWPAGGGKNLLNIPDVAETVASGVTQKIENGHITASGTNTNGYSFYLITSESNWYLDAGTYTLSFTGTHEGYNALYVRDLDNLVTMAALNPNQSSTTFTVSERTHVILYFNASSADKTISVNGYAQLEKGSTATAWSPYENICPISGHTSAVVTRTGKNIAIPTVTEYTLYGVTINSASNGEVTINGTATANITSTTQYFSEMKLSEGTYSIICDYFSTGNMMRVQDIDSNTTLVSCTTADTVFQFSISQPTNIRIFMRFANGTSFSNTKVHYCLAYGNYASLDYETPNIQQVTLDFGQTVYGGSVDVKTGTLTVTHYMITDLEDKTLIYASQNDDGYVVYISPSVNNLPANKVSFGMSNVFSTKIGQGKIGRLAVADNAIYFVLPKVELSSYDIASAKTWLAEKNVQIYYALATPQTYQLSNAQLSTLLGVNNIWADTGDISVTYTSKSKPEISVTTDPTSPESAKIFYFDFKIPETPGPPGEKGDTPVLELSASTTILPSTSAAIVSVTSLSENEFNFNFGIPEAPAPLMSASVSTSTLEPNENANVSVTVNENVFHFDFDIPKGGEGKRGIGVSGIQYKETTTTGDIIYSMNFADPEGTTTFSNDFKVPAGPEGIGFYQKITFTSTDGDDYNWINSGENTSTLVIDRSSNKILPLSIYNLNNNNIAATFTVTSSKSGYPYGTIEYETEEKFDGVLYYIGEAPTPQLAIGSVTTYEGAIASVTTERLGNNYLLNFVFPTKGDTGNGISSIEQVSVEGLTTNYRINYTDNSTPFDFAIRNGEQGIQGQQGIQGIQGNPAGFGEPTISVSSISPDDNPTVSISTSGPDTAKIFDFSFGIPSGRAATIEVDPQITIIESTSSPTVNNIGTSTQAQLHFNLLPSMNYICSTTDLNEGDTLPAGTFYFYYEG